DLQDFLDRQDTEGPFGVGAVPGHVLVTEDALTQKQPGFLVEFPGDREELFVVRLVGLDLLLESFGELRGLLLGVVAVLAQDPVGGTDVDVDVTQGVVRPGLGLDLGDDLGRVPVEVVREAAGAAANIPTVIAAAPVRAVTLRVRPLRAKMDITGTAPLIVSGEDASMLTQITGSNTQRHAAVAHCVFGVSGPGDRIPAGSV